MERVDGQRWPGRYLRGILGNLVAIRQSGRETSYRGKPLDEMSLIDTSPYPHGWSPWVNDPHVVAGFNAKHALEAHNARVAFDKQHGARDVPD